MSTTTRKPDMKKALTSSLNAEAHSFKARLERADAVLGDQKQATSPGVATNSPSLPVSEVLPMPQEATESAVQPSDDQTGAKQDQIQGSAPRSRAKSKVEREPAVATRVIRDSFTMPQTDYNLIAGLRSRCLRSGHSANKSEIMRAGLKALSQMKDGQLIEILESLERVKTGRPSGVD